MIIRIKETDYKVHFGVGFVRELDKKYYIQNQTTGMKFGTGLETTLPILLSKDITELSEYLFVGTYTDEKRPTLEEVDEYLDQVEDIEAVFDEVIQELKKQNATKMIVKKLVEEAERQEAILRGLTEKKE